MPDPRAENCRGYKLDSAGKVVGVYLEHKPLPSSKYELLSVSLLDEYQAAGTTEALCIVLDKNGIQTAERVYLSWPYFTLSNKQLPGNAEGKHMITNGYNTSNSMGPLTLFVGDNLGNPISDMIGGLGLPDNRHVSYRVTWKERGADDGGDDDGGGDDDNGGDDDDGGGSTHDYTLVLGRIADTLERLATHFGA